MDIIPTQFLHDLFAPAPLLALSVTLSLGYLFGKLRIKTFVLGGIAGSLLIGVFIGQLDIPMPGDLQNVFFALFIYAVGYQGGPQFFRSLNKNTVVELFSALITCLLGLFCVLIAAWYFKLDRGTAAGLAAGGLTQSAIIGTASDAARSLNLAPDVFRTIQSNIAVGYAVCYLFGSFGPILLLASVFPGIMGWNLRKEAKLLASRLSADKYDDLAPGQFNALRDVDTRVYMVFADSPLLGRKVRSLYSASFPLEIEAIVRDNKALPLEDKTTLSTNDLVAVTGKSADFLKYSNQIGAETLKPVAMQVIEEVRRIVVTNKNAAHQALPELLKKGNTENLRGVFVTGFYHMGDHIPAQQNLILSPGDEIELVGSTSQLDKVTQLLGYVLLPGKITDFVFFGLGIALGILIGMVSFKIWGVSVTLGSGVGCLFSGLIFGWLKSKHPRCATFPVGASNFLRDFGLAAFVAIIGISAGPQAVQTIKTHGIELFLLGIGVTLIPQIISFYISYYWLKIKNPIVLLSTIAGGRSANPGFAALLEKAGNSTPVVPFTATYAIANILLTLWGSIIISLVTLNPS